MPLNCTEHPECARLAPHGRQVYGRYPGKPFPAADALRILGRRHEVHPYDVWCFLYDHEAHALLVAAADKAHFGHPTWLTTVEGGTLAVLDLRPAMAEHNTPAVDPALPDNVSPRLAWPKYHPRVKVDTTDVEWGRRGSDDKATDE